MKNTKGKNNRKPKSLSIDSVAFRNHSSIAGLVEDHIDITTCRYVSTGTCSSVPSTTQYHISDTEIKSCCIRSLIKDLRGMIIIKGLRIYPSSLLFFFSFLLLLPHVLLA